MPNADSGYGFSIAVSDVLGWVLGLTCVRLVVFPSGISNAKVNTKKLKEFLKTALTHKLNAL